MNGLDDVLYFLGYKLTLDDVASFSASKRRRLASLFHHWADLLDRADLSPESPSPSSSPIADVREGAE